jgi:hypothetical protein
MTLLIVFGILLFSIIFVIGMPIASISRNELM